MDEPGSLVVVMGTLTRYSLVSLTFLLRDLLEFFDESWANRLRRSESLDCRLFPDPIELLGLSIGTARSWSDRG